MQSPRLEERYRIIGTGQEAEQGNSDSQAKNLGVSGLFLIFLKQIELWR